MLKLQVHMLLCTTLIYALHLQVSLSFQSPPFSRSKSTTAWAGGDTCNKRSTGRKTAGSSTSTKITNKSERHYLTSIHIPTACFTCSTDDNTGTGTLQEEHPNGNSNTFNADPQLFKRYPLATPESLCWAYEQNIDGRHALTHSLFQEVGSHLRSNTAQNGSRAACSPFLIRRNADNVDADAHIIEFTYDDLECAIASDYLDACTGKSRNDDANSNFEQKGGWCMEGLGPTQGDISTSLNSNANEKDSQHSFQSKRLHWTSVLDAQNTIVFNSAGAYISSQLAPTSLAALHGLNGAATGVSLNLYVTKSDIRQSAPPHTDKQDVVVIQTQGRKKWRIYSPPDSAVKSHADSFCRGKGQDELSVQMLNDEGSELLLDVTLLPGDVLFVPARFPHTTDTLNCYDDIHSTSSASGIFDGDGDDGNKEKDASIHVTLGLDTHVWAMNYMSMRTLALRRFDIHDVLESDDRTVSFDRNMDKCVGKVNQLSCDLREGLFSSLDNTCCDGTLVLEKNMARSRMLAKNLLMFHERANIECGWVDKNHNSLTLDQCLETVIHFQTIAQKIIKSHDGMYIAALEEERRRDVEGGGWAMNVGDVMVKERADRLSIFRVPVFFEQLDELREELRAWGDREGDQVTSTGQSSRQPWMTLPIILNGDQVEANLLDNSYAGAKCSWLSAKIVKVRSDGLFNLQLFDGTMEEGVDRHDIKGPHGLGVFI
jgi:hypothetical protein